MQGANQSISAGLGGFLAFFVLAIALWLLMRSMLPRLRNVRFEEEQEDARLAAEGARPRRRQVFLPVDDRDPLRPRDASQPPADGATERERPDDDPGRPRP